jgi:hypothetical protein
MDVIGKERGARPRTSPVFPLQRQSIPRCYRWMDLELGEVPLNEGWLGDEYLILFGDDEVPSVTKRYRLGEWLPEFTVVGFRGWDDFIVRDAHGRTHTIPTVPLDQELLAPFSVPHCASLEPDDRYVGKMKWYIHPLVFGGDAEATENIAWLDHEQHAELVAWWNAKYKELKETNVGT